MGLSKAWKELAILLGITALAFSMRLISFKHGYLLEVDPYHHYHEASKLLQSGAVVFAGLYAPAIILFSILSPFGISFYDAFRLTTPLLGSLAILPVYFIVREALSSRAALLSSLILALLPAYVYRNLAGFYRGDSYFVLLSSLCFLFFLRACREGDSKRLAAFSLAGAIFFALMGAAWQGAIYGVVMLAAFAVFYAAFAYVTARDFQRAALAYGITAVAGTLLLNFFAAVQPIERPWWLHELNFYILPSSIAALAVLAALKLKADTIETNKKIALLSALGVVSIASIATLFPEKIKWLFSGLVTASAGGSLQTTLELQPIDMEVLWQKYSVVSALAVAGFILFLSSLKQKLGGEKIFILVWALSSAYLLTLAMRYAFLASLPVAIMGALALEQLFKIRLPKRAPELACTALLVFTFFSGVSYAEQSKPMITDEWNRALLWVKDSTPNDAVVLSWWDFGYWIEAVAERKPIIDPGQGDQAAIKEIAEMLLEVNESKVRETLHKYNASYIILPTDMIGHVRNIQMIAGSARADYVIYPYQGQAKIGSVPVENYGGEMMVMSAGADKGVVYIGEGKPRSVRRVYWRENGKLNFRDYSNLNLSFVDGAAYVSPRDLFVPALGEDNFLIYVPPQLESTLLSALMLFDGKGFKSFELVHANSEVRIYRIRDLSGK